MIRYYPDLVQGTDDWLAARCGLLTASEMKLVLTPTLKPAANDKERAHLYELLAQRISGYVEPSYFNDDMLRGQEDEIAARALYHDHIAPVTETGFVTNDRFGFPIGFSPDGLVGDTGLIECKSRKQRLQVETILEMADRGIAPCDFMLQIQTGLLVTEREWCDWISFSAGLPMVVSRVHPIPEVQDAIVEAATAFEARLRVKRAEYEAALRTPDLRLLPTERRVEMEITL